LKTLSKVRSRRLRKARSMKTEKIETVDRTITVKLPRRLDEYLQGLARALNRTVENMLLEDLYAKLECFFQGGFAEDWTLEILDGSEGKNLEQEVTEVANVVLNQSVERTAIL